MFNIPIEEIQGSFILLLISIAVIFTVLRCAYTLEEDAIRLEKEFAETGTIANSI